MKHVFILLAIVLFSVLPAQAGKFTNPTAAKVEQHIDAPKKKRAAIVKISPDYARKKYTVTVRNNDSKQLRLVVKGFAKAAGASHYPNALLNAELFVDPGATGVAKLPMAGKSAEMYQVLITERGVPGVLDIQEFKISRLTPDVPAGVKPVKAMQPVKP